MNKLRSATILISLAVSLHGLFASTGDSIVSRRSLFIIPHASYQQETSVAPGIAYGYYFKSKDISKISSISGSAIYTFRNQFILNISPKIYFNNAKWFLSSNLNLKKYPDYYYGISNKPTETKQAFTSQNISVLVQPQYILSKHFFVGASISGRSERTFCTAGAATKDSLFKQYGSAGWEPYSQISIGLVAAYDTRDNQFYPQYGFFAKTAFSNSMANVGSNYSLQEFSLDCRKYIPLFKSHVLAWQAYCAGIIGNNGIPFQMLPTVGGRDLLRGYRQGMYRENLLFLVQSEYRIPIYKRLKAAIFCSAGDVLSNSDYNINKLKVAYGAGLRYRLNDARVHLRVDVAKNNYGEKLQLYITATEAF